VIWSPSISEISTSSGLSTIGCTMCFIRSFIAPSLSLAVKNHKIMNEMSFQRVKRQFHFWSYLKQIGIESAGL
jgi:hypothetical protein